MVGPAQVLRQSSLLPYFSLLRATFSFFPPFHNLQNQSPQGFLRDGPVEAGAAYIHGDDTELYEFAERQKLHLEHDSFPAMVSLPPHNVPCE